MAADQKSDHSKLTPDNHARLNRIGKLSQNILLTSARDLEPGEQTNPGEFLMALAMVAAHTILEYYDGRHQDIALAHHAATIQSLVREKKTLEKS